VAERNKTERTSRRPRKNVLMFMLSLAIGGAGVMFSKNYIEDQIAYYKGQLDQTEPMVSVVVPARKIIRGEVVNPEMLVTREIPAQYADSNSVGVDNYEIALGQRVEFDIDEGRPLLWAHLEGGLTPTFSGKVEDGLRAMTVRVDEINSISGFLQPKDRVDLLMSHGSGDDQEIFPLIERLNVIATGVQTLVDKNSDGATRNFSTITVQVSPDQAQRITLAQKVGQITAVLRNPDDDAPLGEQAMNVNDLLGIVTPPPATVAVARRPVVRKPPPPTVEFIIGGS